MRISVYTIFCLFLLAGTPAQAVELHVALSQLLRNSPNIQAAEQDRLAREQGIGVAESELLPNLSLSSEIGKQTVSDPSRRADGEEDKPLTRRNATFTLTQTIFDGNTRRIDIRIAELNTKLSSITTVGTLQRTLLDGVTAYINVLRQQRLLDLSRESEARIQRQLNLEDERVRRGSGITVDVLTAKSRLQVAKERRVNFEGQLENALHTYLKTFLFPANPEAMFDPVPPVEALPSSLDRAIIIGRTENPAVRTADTNISIALEEERTARAELYPTIDLEAEYLFEQNDGGSRGTERDLQFNVVANWELFTGFSSLRSESQRAFETQAERVRREQAMIDVEEQVRLSWQNLVTLRERVSLLENAVNIASEVAVSRRLLREAGRETVLNVLDAENEVNNAQINFTSAAYDEKLSVYQLLLGMGRLDPLTLDLRVASAQR